MELLSTPLIKSLHYFATPIGVMLLLLACIFLCKLIGFKKLKYSIWLLFIGAFFTFTTPLGSSGLDRFLNNFVTFSSVDEVDPMQYQAIIVAGWSQAMLPNDIRLDEFWSGRLYSAASLYAKNPMPIIVISSQFPIPAPPNPGEMTYAKSTLIKWGVAPRDIIITKPGETTHDAMNNAFIALVSRDVSSVLLVGYRYRLARKSGSLERRLENHFIDASKYQLLAVAADAKKEHQNYNPWHLSMWLPNAKSLMQSTYTFHELLGLLAYSVNGWLPEQ